MNNTLEKTLNVIFGISSVIGLLLTISGTAFLIWHKDKIDINNVLLSLVFNSIGLTLVFIIASRHFIKNLDSIKTVDYENKGLKIQIKDNEIFAKNTAEYFFNLMEYTQKISYTLDKANEKTVTSSLSKEDLNGVYDDVHSFMQTFSSNLHSYFTLRTKDNCAITIKIVNSKNKIKTFFRDPISYNKRRQSDFENGTEVVMDIKNNFGFLVITSNDYRESYYCNDNLYDDKNYKNGNPNWKELYRATAIAPITNCQNESNKKILGFVCVDNFNGGLSHQAIIDFLSGASLMIYPIFEKFDKLSQYAKINNITHDRFKKYADWSNS